jgi:hypothetical protein
MNNFDIRSLLDFFEYWKKFTQPTEFYCEGWLTRLLIFSVTDCGLKDHDLYINETCKYFSEPLLGSPFLARTRTDSLAESYTHADSAIGEFQIGDEKNKGSLILLGNSLKIIEAKIYSEFSERITHSESYNQAARYIACVTETIDRAKKIDDLADLSIGFYLTVPEFRYNDNKTNYSKFMDKGKISEVVRERVEQYKNEGVHYSNLKSWFDSKFCAVLERIKISPIFYEDIIADLQDYKFVNEINSYYEMCLEYNKQK